MRSLSKAVCRWCCGSGVSHGGVRGSIPVPWGEDDDERWDGSGEVTCPTSGGRKSLSDAFERCWARGVHESGVLVLEGEEDDFPLSSGSWRGYDG